jgi:DNA-binding CsgD family transcriptional regulator
VFISDPETHAETLDEFARRLYGLTHTEARVANAFAASGSLEQVGEHLGLTRETVRWHLRHLYRKTGTHRQAALLTRLSDASSRFALRASGAVESRRARG